MFEFELQKIGLPLPFEKAAALVALASVFAAAAEAFLVFQKTGPSEWLIVLSTALLPPVLFYFFLEYLRQARRLELLRGLPIALLQMASFPRGSPVEKMISSVADSDSGAVSEEFSKIRARIVSGESVPSALCAQGTGKPAAFSRSLSLIAEGYKSGADLSQPLQALAGDLIGLREIAEEAAAAFSLQKYTLLAGSAAILPGVLAVLLSLVSTLSAGGIAEGGQAPELSSAFEFSMQAYLLAFAGLSSLFIASAEGAARRAVLYFSCLAPVSLLVFNAVKAFA
ncbi:MAG: type II secretion system F family protein [Candidatus Micrarchaeia archaeon]|jgi:hypothetical protein